MIQKLSKILPLERAKVVDAFFVAEIQRSDEHHGGEDEYFSDHFEVTELGGKF